jgi:hypothetical protein
MKNRKIFKCIICGLATTIIFQSTPYCQECHKKKHEHLPEKNYESEYLNPSYSITTSGLNASASPSPPSTFSTTILKDNGK